MIFVHQNLDLDAVASLWAWLTLVNADAYSFRPANWDGAEMTDDDVALDMEAGGRGWKGEQNSQGQIGSCFATIIREFCSQDQQKALSPLVRLIDAQDKYGNAYKALGLGGEALEICSLTGLNAVFRAFQATNHGDDFQVADQMFEVFDGLYKNGLSRLEAEKEADQVAVWVSPEVCLINNARKVATMNILMDRGAKIVVYVDSCNLGLVRRSDVTISLDHPLIRELVAHEQGWFFHPAGFLAARGTRKAPTQTPSQINPMALAVVAVKLLQA